MLVFIIREENDALPLCVILSKHLLVSRMDRGACEHTAPFMEPQSTLGHNFYAAPSPLPPLPPQSGPYLLFRYLDLNTPIMPEDL